MLLMQFGRDPDGFVRVEGAQRSPDPDVVQSG